MILGILGKEQYQSIIKISGIRVIKNAFEDKSDSQHKNKKNE